MKYRRFLPGLFVFFLCLSCAASPESVPPPAAEAAVEAAPPVPEESEAAPPGEGEDFPLPPIPPGMEFLPADFPSIEMSPGVGLITRNAADRASSLNQAEKDALLGSFREAYIDGLLRGLPLEGVLGGDEVHGWPPGNPSAWAQNWRSSVSLDNSWGIPRLILAVRGIRPEAAAGRVFVVRGGFLDRYGRSGGLNGANGDSGYGSPRSDEFFHEGKPAQRFDYGLMTIDAKGNSLFLPEAPPSLEAETPPGTGIFGEGVPASVPPEFIERAFVTARNAALDRGVEAMIPDGSGEYLPLEGGDFPGGDALRGVYIQSFNGNTVVLALPDSPLLPFYPRLITSPFLEALLASSKNPLPGGENLAPREIASADSGAFTRALAQGIALYGIPLGDPMPLLGEDAPPREVQRFSRGWIMSAPFLSVETAEETEPVEESDAEPEEEAEPDAELETGQDPL